VRLELKCKDVLLELREADVHTSQKTNVTLNVVKSLV